jgi:hypothetical protein
MKADEESKIVTTAYSSCRIWVLQTGAQRFDLFERQFLAVFCEIQNFEQFFFLLSRIFKPLRAIILNMSLVISLKFL